MTDINQPADVLMPPPGKPRIPTGINVLTILTLIWSAYELYSAFKNFIGGQKALEKLEESQEKLASAPAWARKMAGPDVMEMLRKGIENKIPILVIGLLSVGLCVYGALEMRKLKKQGYFFWLIGEILPWISAIIFIGPVMFKTFIAYFMIFPLLFIILYTTQRKYLVN
jgi:hypothetical protein